MTEYSPINEANDKRVLLGINKLARTHGRRAVRIPGFNSTLGLRLRPVIVNILLSKTDLLRR
jgi:hypothetical protein